MVRQAILFLALLFISPYCLAGPEFIHLKEEYTVKETVKLLKGLDNARVRESVLAEFPDVNEYLAQIQTEILEFHSAVSGKTRPVIRYQFEYSRPWGRSTEFQRYIVKMIRGQIPDELLY